MRSVHLLALSFATLACLAILPLFLKVSREKPQTAAVTKAATGIASGHRLRPVADTHGFDDAIDELVVGIGTDPTVLKYRTNALVIQATWATRFRNVLWFSKKHDDLAARLALKTRFIAPHAADPWLDTKFGGAWLALPMLKAMFEHNQKAQWYFVADDDTFVVPPNVVCLLRQWNSSDLLYKGWRACYDMKDKICSKSIAVGGPGYLISNALMTELYPVIDGCIESTLTMWASDIRVGMCIRTLLSTRNADDPFSVLQSKMDVPGFHHVSVRAEAEFRANASQGLSKGALDSLMLTNHKTLPVDVMHAWEAIVKARRKGLPLTFSVVPQPFPSISEASLSNARWHADKTSFRWMQPTSRFLRLTSSPLLTCLVRDFGVNDKFLVLQK